MHIEIAPYLIIITFIVGGALDSIYNHLFGKKERFKKSHNIMMITIMSVFAYSVIATIAGYANYALFPEYSAKKDNIHVVYQNNKQADVTFKDSDDYVYTGGDQSKEKYTIAKYLTGSSSRELTISKNNESITKQIDESEIIGDKDGIVKKIEYGTRTRTYGLPGAPAVSIKKSFVRVHLSPKNPADRKIVEDIFNGKE